MSTGRPVSMKSATYFRKLARGCLVAGFMAGLVSAPGNPSWATQAPLQQVAWQLAIDRAPLSDALMQLAKQVDIQLAHFADDRSTQAPVGPFVGTYTREAALDLMLQGTGLTYRFVNDHTIAILREAASAPPAEAAGIATPNRQGFWSRIRGFFIGNGEQNLNRNSNSTVTRAVVLCGSMAVACAANAQTAGSGAPAAPPDELSEVTVTGSRIITNGANSPTPVTVVTAETIDTVTPTTIFEGLQNMPAFAGSETASNGTSAAGSTQRNAGGLSLRGVESPARTLVLLDGKRMPATQGDGQVSIDMIPQMLLQRVDVVTGGVSAVYGSDGITGVVNFVTDRNFNGVKVQSQAGISDYYDDPSNKVSIAAGVPLFGGRGHLEGGFERFEDAGVRYKTERQFGVERWTNQGSGTADFPYFLTPDATIAITTFGGKIVGPATNPLLNQQFVDRGALVPFRAGATAGVIGNIQIGGDGAYYTAASLKEKRLRNQFFGRFDFDISDSLHYFVQVAGTALQGSSTTLNNELNRVTLRTDNPFLAPAYRTAMAAFPTFTLSKMWPVDDVRPIGADNRTRQWMAFTGLEGGLGKFRWETGYMHGWARQRNIQPNTIDNGRLAAALDAVVNPANGQIVCNVTLTNPGLYPGCVPLNPFGYDSESAEAIDYILARAEFVPTMVTDDVSAAITGPVFDNWAGPVNMALSAEWRKVEYDLVSSAVPALFDPLSCTGLRYNCAPFDPVTGNGTAKLFTTVSNRPPVSQTVKEAAIEADVPLIKNAPFAADVNLNLAYRYAKYSISGNPIITEPNFTNTFSAKVWKVGLDWHFNDAIALRATRSRDFRAPTLVDLYEPGSVTITSRYQDTLTGVTPVALLQQGGNPDLDPEISDTTTIGLVWKPAESLNVSVDAYRIDILNEIDTGGGYSPSAQRICQSSGGTAIQCTQAIRPFPITNTTPANAVTKWIRSTLNLAQLQTYGLDFEANYRGSLWGHAFSVRPLLTYAPHTRLIQNGAETQESSGVAWAPTQGGAKWRTTIFARFNVTDAFTVDWMTKWRSSLHTSSYASEFVRAPDKIPSIAFSNVNLGYQFAERSWGQLGLYLNVQNVFNKYPYPAASLGAQGTPGVQGGYAPSDDVIGRYYTVGLRFRM
jgi:iron complex outermembrane receptor protein